VLPAGALAGWASHPLKNASFARRTLVADLPAGARPDPWMALQCVLALKIGDVAHRVKVDDTLPGISEGVNAGMWTVGLALPATG
jgi:HAD superfamily hydrolase (TIGR01509 family)